MFCQEMQLKNVGHFYRAPVFKNAISVLMFCTWLFLRIGGLIFEVKLGLSNQN